MLGDDAFFIIGNDGDPLLRGKAAQLGHELRPQNLLVEGLPRAAVHDAAAVVRQDAAALFVQPKVFGQRQDARRGAARSQHDGHALRSGGIQRSPGAGGDLLLIVGQGAVQIQCQHPNVRFCHIFLTSLPETPALHFIFCISGSIVQ